MLKVPLDNVRVRVRMGWEATGSVLAGTIASRCTRAESELIIDSPASPELVAALVQSARGGCFVDSTLREPVDLQASTILNGQPFDAEALPSKPPPREARG